MWGARRRLSRLDDETATAGAGQAEVTAHLAVTGSAVPAAPMPRELLAAAHDAGNAMFPVRLQLAGASVVAVVCGEGDPREWWTAIWQFAGSGASSVAAIRRQLLPIGLVAVAVRGTSDPAVAVSDAIEPDRQRAAVQLALSAWPAASDDDRAADVAADAAASNRSFRTAALLRATVAVVAALVLAASAAFLLSLARHHQGQPVSLSGPGSAPAYAQHQFGGRTGAGGRSRTNAGAPDPGRTRSKGGGPTAHHRAKPTSSASARPTGSPAPTPGPSKSRSASAAPTPSPSSGSTTPAPSPDPTATPTPSSTTSGHCVTVLGIKVCL